MGNYKSQTDHLKNRLKIEYIHVNNILATLRLKDGCKITELLYNDFIAIEKSNYNDSAILTFNQFKN